MYTSSQQVSANLLTWQRTRTSNTLTYSTGLVAKILMSRWVSTGLETGTWGVFTPNLIPVLAIFFSLVTVVEGDSDMGGGSASLGLALTVSPLTVKFSSRFRDDFSQHGKLSRASPAPLKPHTHKPSFNPSVPSSPISGTSKDKR